VGTDGTIASYDYEPHVTVQTRARPEPTPVPVDALPVGRRNAIEYVLGCIAEGRPVEGPLDPGLCLTAQRIVDTAYRSAAEKRTLELVP
jgi:glucose-fructose oxidoreductase